ncbi:MULTISPECIES: 50S ribosomal protein L25/general stress protein Ctc [Nosocomiicoccus]|uniref:50S ribosomal protein L25/general stress protein Ctc n=1 Tax=Nosocomiicoccus TaxID=489909 RepID=UPI0008A28996|nr:MULTISPECIES: 50S ribosomal protein L25/general stress protein Ctc [Nosocomiicoccus]MDK6863692.1 50S ribosomal protein L25/general stress protein Ctc [Nosocomiicoccus ampullae]OFO49912.1 50S ribosomal protein L25/general stress protein Ctc [Nosocomiicoccus sp. HMSC059G07]
MAKLVANSRESLTKGELNELRAAGKVPAVLYGYNVENTSVTVDEVEFIKLIRKIGRNGVIDLELDGKTVQAMVNEYQFESLKNRVDHIDFIAINMDEERTVEVSVVTVGEAAGEKEGGVVEQPNFVVEVTARPADIPEELEVNVEALEIGDSITVGDIRDKFSFTIENEDDTTLAMVSVPQEEVEEDAEDSEEATEEAPAEGSSEDEE